MKRLDVSPSASRSSQVEDQGLATEISAVPAYNPMPEGNGTVLDNSCLMFLNNLWSGRKHDNSRLPLVLAGGLGGTLKTGRALNFLKAGDDNRKLCSLYLSLMDRVGLKLNRFGDAETRLANL